MNKKLTRKQKQLLEKLRDYQRFDEKDDDGFFEKRIKDMMIETGLSNNTIMNATRKLEEIGYLEIKRGNYNEAFRYKLKNVPVKKRSIITDFLTLIGKIAEIESIDELNKKSSLLLEWMKKHNDSFNYDHYDLFDKIYQYKISFLKSIDIYKKIAFNAEINESDNKPHTYAQLEFNFSN